MRWHTARNGIFCLPASRNGKKKIQLTSSTTMARVPIQFCRKTRRCPWGILSDISMSLCFNSAMKKSPTREGKDKGDRHPEMMGSARLAGALTLEIRAAHPTRRTQWRDPSGTR